MNQDHSSGRPSHAPPALDSWQSAVLEAEELRHADPAEHFRLLEEACALAFAILDARADRQAALEYRDPLPAESVALLERLRGVSP